MGGMAAPSDGPPLHRLVNFAVYRSSPVHTPPLTWVDVTAITPARTVIYIREGRVEMGIRLDQIGHTVCGQIGVDVVDVHTVAEHIIREHVARLVVRRAAFVSREDAADSHAEGDIHGVVSQPAAVGVTRPVARQQA